MIPVNISVSLIDVAFPRPHHDLVDRTPYKSHPFAQTHPDRLAVISTPLGMQPPPIETAYEWG